MRTLFILSIIMTISNLSFSQLKGNGSDWLNKSLADSINNAIKIQVNKELTSYKKSSDRELGFIKDTLEIELYLDAAEQAVKYSDISTMRLIYEALDKYDALLNKYYNELLSNAISKKTLIETQRAWITFRDKEIDYYSYEIAGNENLSNLGTLDRVAIASFSLRLTKDRTIEIFRGIK